MIKINRELQGIINLKFKKFSEWFNTSLKTIKFQIEAFKLEKELSPTMTQLWKEKLVMLSKMRQNLRVIYYLIFEDTTKFDEYFKEVLNETKKID